MQRTRWAAATSLALLGLSVSACTTSAGSSKAAASLTPHESLAPARTTGAPDSTQAAQVIASVSAYVRMLDDLRTDPTRPLDDIYQVAVAPDATAEASAVGRLRSQGYRQTGRSQVVTASLVGAASTGPVSTASSPAVPSVVVNACIDAGQVDAVDNDGKSVLPPGRPRYLIEQLTLISPHYPNPTSWRVSKAANRQAGSCSG